MITGTVQVREGRIRLKVRGPRSPEREIDVHVAKVVWDGNERRVLVDEADTDPLVGMALLIALQQHSEASDGFGFRKHHT